MKINEHAFNDVTVLEIHGNILGGRESTRLTTCFADLVKTGRYKVVLDMANVNWMNIAGLGILMGAFTTMRNHRGDLRLAAPTERIQTLLKSANVLNIVDHHHDVEGAVARFK